MSTILKYNNNDPFINYSPYPFASKSVGMVKYGEQWCQLDKITLQGQITGKCHTFAEMVERQKGFLSGWQQDFKTFEIYENGSLIYNKPFSKITNISFGDSNYQGIIPYTLEIECYPQNFFDGTFGVLDPNESISYEETQDGILNITHEISARGFCTDANYTNALDNAKNFVQSKTGYISNILPAFIKYCYIAPCLKSQSENIDRLNATYSVSETYTSDLRYSGYGTLRYTVDYSSGIQDGISRVDVKGNINACRNQTMSGIRARYYNFDSYSEAITYYSGITNLIDLNPNPLSSGITEDPVNKKMTFDITFNNDKMPKTIFDYKVTFNYDYMTDFIDASIDGTIRSKGNIKDKWNNVLAYYSGVNLYNLILPKYIEYANSLQNGLGAYPLNPKPTSKSETFNQFSAEIGLSASFNSRPIPPDGFDMFEYGLNFVPSIQRMSEVPCLNSEGVYVVFDLGYTNRQSFSIDGQVVISQNVTPSQGIQNMKTQVALLRNQYFNGNRMVLDSQNYSESNKSFGRTSSFNVGFSSEGDRFYI